MGRQDIFPFGKKLTMLINFKSELIDVRDGDALVIDKVNKKTKAIETVPITFQYVAGEALCNIDAKDNLSAEEKYKISKLLDKVFSTPECEVTDEELDLIKERTAKFYGPIVLLAIDKLLK